MDSTMDGPLVATPPESHIAVVASAPSTEYEAYLPPPYRTLRGYAPGGLIIELIPNVT
jgi:hypothetical protein